MENSDWDFFEAEVYKESLLNEYSIVDPLAMGDFPGSLLCYIESAFKGIPGRQSGVAFFINERTLLTAGHNLYIIALNQDRKACVQKAEYVSVHAGLNGFIKKLEVSVSRTFYIKQDLSLLDEHAVGKVENDWGIIFLDSAIGNYLCGLPTYSGYSDRLYDYFIEFLYLNNKDYLRNQISMLSYTTDEKSEIKYRKAIKKFVTLNKSYQSLVDCREKKQSNKSIFSYSNDLEAQSNGNQASFSITKEPNHLLYVLKALKLGKSNTEVFFTDSRYIMTEVSSENSLKLKERSLFYSFSTFQGQSGSPIFLRSSRGNSTLIGLHSRRGSAPDSPNMRGNERGLNEYCRLNIGLRLHKDMLLEIQRILYCNKLPLACLPKNAINTLKLNLYLFGDKVLEVLADRELQGKQIKQYVINSIDKGIKLTYSMLSLHLISLNCSKSYEYTENSRLIEYYSLLDSAKPELNLDLRVDIRLFSKKVYSTVLKQINRQTHRDSKAADASLEPKALILTVFQILKPYGDLSNQLMGLVFNHVWSNIRAHHLK